MTETELIPGQAEAGGGAPDSPVPRLLLLGLGNDLLSDDAVGLKIVREIQSRLPPTAPVTVQETGEMGLSLLDWIAGYDELVVVDAIQTGHVSPGDLIELEGGDLKVLPTIAPHFFGLGEILALGRELGMPMPRRVKIFAIEVEDPFTIATTLSPPLTKAFPALVDRVLSWISAARSFSAPDPS